MWNGCGLDEGIMEGVFREQGRQQKKKKVITGNFWEMSDVNVNKMGCVWRKQKYEHLW